MLTPSPRVAITSIFFLNGAVFSAWYARLPAIADELRLGPGELGVALLAAPLGLLAAQPAAGALVARRGSRALLGAAPLLTLAVALPALAGDLPALVLAVVVVGAANGTLDIAMNAQGLAVERTARTRLFASLHAAFSFGALFGASAAGVAAAAGVDPLAHLLAWGSVGAAAVVVAARGLVADVAAADDAARRIARPTRRLAALGVVAFCALLAEGAVFDWSSVYLARDAGAAAGLAPLGLAAFSVAMGVGRLVADRLAARRGAAAVARAGALLGAAGMAGALALAVPGPAIAGYAVMGLGLAAVFPLTLRAAGLAGAHTGPELAAVSTIGYTGFLLGPPCIGLLADGVGLRAALLTVTGCCVLAAALAGTLRAPAGGAVPAAGARERD